MAINNSVPVLYEGIIRSNLHLTVNLAGYAIAKLRPHCDVTAR